jgi:hypothetical protein
MFRIILHTKFAISNPNGHIHRINIRRYCINSNLIPDNDNNINHSNNIVDYAKKYEIIDNRLKSLEWDMKNYGIVLSEVNGKIKCLENALLDTIKYLENNQKPIHHEQDAIYALLCVICVITYMVINIVDAYYKNHYLI